MRATRAPALGSRPPRALRPRRAEGRRHRRPGGDAPAAACAQRPSPGVAGLVGRGGDRGRRLPGGTDGRGGAHGLAQLARGEARLPPGTKQPLLNLAALLALATGLALSGGGVLHAGHDALRPGPLAGRRPLCAGGHRPGRGGHAGAEPVEALSRSRGLPLPGRRRRQRQPHLRRREVEALRGVASPPTHSASSRTVRSWAASCSRLTERREPPPGGPGRTGVEAALRRRPRRRGTDGDAGRNRREVVG